MNNFEFSFLGKIEYKDAEKIQEAVADLARLKKINAVLGLEHPLVMTLGHRMNLQDFAEGPDTIPVVKSSRGGLATIHSEGQLVIYPILNMRESVFGVRTYVLKLMQTTQNLLLDLGIDSQIDEKAVGLFTREGKIAFCGIQIKNGISLHGISLNVRNDLSLFQNWEACGVQNAKFDRLQNHGVNLSLQELFERWVAHFRKDLQIQ